MTKASAGWYVIDVSGVDAEGNSLSGLATVELEAGTEKIGIPVFSTAVSPNAGEPKGFGEIGADISCCGQQVKTGDWIVGDESGVVVIPKKRAYEIARRALEVRKNEVRIREEIKRGGTLSSVAELLKWEKK